jgi:streptomycin 6-kinase
MHYTYIIPENFRKTIREVFPDTGERWLAQLPGLLAGLEERWSIRIDAPFPLSYNYVALATCAGGANPAGTTVVLKAGHPNPELTSEMTALRLFAGRGIAHLLECDLELGVMLLEHIRPGVPLAELEDDDTATRIAAKVMRQLWLDAPADPDHMLRTAAGWGRGFQRLRQEFGGGTGPFPPHLVEQAERLYADLLASSGPMRLLHGDLHHWNILSAERQPWLALDPKGLIGEAEYEVGALTRNRWPGSSPGKTALRRQANRRLDIFAEVLGFDRQRMLQWCMAQAMLSAWWSYEDHHVVEAGMITFTETLSDMIG